MICWYCYWGWAQPVVEIYERAKKDIESLGYDGESSLEYGPAHIVWSDENWDSDEWCIEQIDTRKDINQERFPPEVLAIIRRSLVGLKELPEPVKFIEPEDYDGASPEKFPPKVGVLLARKS